MRRSSSSSLILADILYRSPCPSLALSPCCLLLESFAETFDNFEKVEKDSDRDYWMRSAEAKEYGMIDEVLLKDPKKG